MSFSIENTHLTEPGLELQDQIAEEHEDGEDGDLVEGGLLVRLLALWLTEGHLIGQIGRARLSDERFLVERKWTGILGQ